jgi:hypothetical protein
MSERPTPAPQPAAGLPVWIALTAGGVALAAAVTLGYYFLGPGYVRHGLGEDVPDGKTYWNVFVFGRWFVFLMTLILLANILHARRGGPMFIRRIAGLNAIDETVGRATEMGRPISFALGLGKLEIITLQALGIALHVIRLAIKFGTRVILTMADPTVYAVADEAVQEAYASAGRPESFSRDDVRFLSDRQFAYASAMVGLISRERVASNYMFGRYYAEALIMAECGNQVGAIQVAGTPTITQIPFFIAACDYTIIGDEYYAATAYLTREPVLTGSLVGQDRCKIIIVTLIVLALITITVLGVMGATGSPQVQEQTGAIVKFIGDLFKQSK